MKNVNRTHKEKLTKTEKFALWITQRIGTMQFFFIIFCWTVCWLGWNMFAPTHLRFDSYPAFVLWLIVSNMIQIFLMPLIMIGQNIQSKHAELLAENDFELNSKSEREIKQLHNKIDLLLSYQRKYIELLEKVSNDSQIVKEQTQNEL